MEPELRETLRHIGRDVALMRDVIAPPWYRLVWYGFLRGAGFIIGTVIAVALASWILSLFGVFPGIGDVAEYLRTILNRQTGA